MDILFVIIMVVTGFLFVARFKISEKSIKNLRLLWAYHLLITCAYYFLTRNGGGDAWVYWSRAKQMTSEEFWLFLLDEKGTYFIYAINYVAANILGMGFFSNTLLYSLLGFFGLVFFYITAIKMIPYNSKLYKYKIFPAVLFLPNLHYWSSGLGKDSLLFFCIGFFCYAIYYLPKKIPQVLFALVFAYLVRPHIAFFLLISFGFAYLLDSKIKSYKRILFSLLLLGVGIQMLPIVMEFAKIEELSVESIDQFSDKHVELLAKSGSGVDISSYPFPLKLFTFLYRPLFFDINGVPAVIASFENLVLLILTVKVFSASPLKSFRRSPFVIKGLLLFFLIGSIAFSLSLSNLGIMLRMRNMFLPGFLIFVLWTLSGKRSALTDNRRPNKRPIKTHDDIEVREP